MATSTDNPVDLDAAPRDNGASAMGTKLKRKICIILSCGAPNGRRIASLFAYIVSAVVRPPLVCPTCAETKTKIVVR